MVGAKDTVAFECSGHQARRTIDVRSNDRPATNPPRGLSQRDGGLKVMPRLFSQAVGDNQQLTLPGHRSSVHVEAEVEALHEDRLAIARVEDTQRR